MKTVFHTLLICSFLLSIPLVGTAKIYKYRDASGQLTFVDDESKIPAQFRDDVTSVSEAQDSLVVYDDAFNDEETEEALSARQEEVVRIAIEKEFLKYQTPVDIVGNRVLVPVEVAIGNRATKLSLLLDTGATSTVLHRDSLAELDLPSGKQYKAMVAGGGIVKSNKIKFRKINIGPFQVEKPYAMVINLKGRDLPFDGMLGMDFLRSHPYQVDFENEVINWQVPD